MPKTKAQEKAPGKAPPPATIEEQVEAPEKQGGPLPTTRAGDLMMDPEQSAGATGRARAMIDMQQAVGNTRLSRMLSTTVQMKVAVSAPNEEEAAGGEASTIQREKGEPITRQKKRHDVVIIVGRPSRTIPREETPQEKEQMEAWRAAARALSPHVLEGLTVDRAFSGLRRLTIPIGKLYLIAHADVSGIGEVSAGGASVSTTVEDLTKRMKEAAGSLGAHKPVSVEMLSCFGGGSPKTMGRIGEALGAAKVRAPVQMTVISGRSISVNGKRLTAREMQKTSDKTLIEYIQKTDALKYYDFVPGVPHPQPSPSNEGKLKALAGVLRQTGMIPFVSFNAEPGKRDAVPYWRAPVEKKKKTAELSIEEQLVSRGLIEVNLQDPEKEQ